VKQSWSIEEVRNALLMREEIALVDLRTEAAFASGHPLFASQFTLDGLEAEAAARIPRRSTAIALYGPDDDVCDIAARRLQAAGYEMARPLAGNLAAWVDAGYELFGDVNSPSKAFGELVEARRHTPSLSASEVHSMIADGADMAILDARRTDEFMTMCIPGGTSVPGAELVLRASAVVPDPRTTIVVNCAGRTRSIIGTQSLVNAGVANPVRALRNGTIGWLLDGFDLGKGSDATLAQVTQEQGREAAARARDVAYRAGVRGVDATTYAAMAADETRTLYRFDVRSQAEHEAGHPAGFLWVPGGQLVQETDHYAPVRGARIILFDDLSARASMTASWLAQMGWDVVTLEGDVRDMFVGGMELPSPRSKEGRYRRPYEGTDNDTAAMQAYLDWEYGLVDQLARDGTHGFFVI
jgi:rhodanese-related sulfurtransferase